jgi:hypothetical protein
MQRFLLFVLLLLSIVFIGCKKEFIIGKILDNENEILSFDLPNITCNVFFDGSNIYVSVYRNINISKLQPIIEISSKAKIYPPSGTIMDFTYPVTYQVIAENGNISTYKVTVSNTLSNQSDIQVFRLVGTEQIFERIRDSIFIYVPYETDITNIQTYIATLDSITVSPASGTSMNFTTPQTYTTTSTDGTSRKYPVTVKKSPWRKVGNGVFRAMDGVGLVEFKGKMWLVGGWHGIPSGLTIYGYPYAESNEVWNTSDGINWTLISEDGKAPWTGRHCGGVVVYKDSIWVISGDGYPDVWKTNDGKNWELVDSNAPWGRRYGPYVTVFNNKLWLIGGVDWWNNNGDWVREQGTKAFNDVWSSTDGKNWVRELEFAPFAQRGMIQGSVIWNNELYIIGGGSRAGWPPYSVFNDIWKTKNGKNWTRITHNAEWSPRLHHTIIVYDNKLWIVSGTTNSANLNNDVWYSENGGVNWHQLKHSFFPITHATSLCVFQDKLWMVSGYHHNQIWVLEDK